MKELLEKFEDYLLNNLPKIDTFHPHFENAMQDMLKAGGKRFRPMLLLSVVNSKKPLLVEIPDRHGSAKIGETIDAYISEAIGIKL